MIADGGIATILGTIATPREAAEALITAAKAAGGGDNVTAVVCDVDGEELAEPSSEDDLPRYTELDPHEEGERALYSTSYVARRLAARVGIGDDPGPPIVPATGQHMVIRRGESQPGLSSSDDVIGPARRIARSRGLPLWVWVAILAAAAIAGWIAAGAW
jgi:hypothetical protein